MNDGGTFVVLYGIWILTMKENPIDFLIFNLHKFINLIILIKEDLNLIC